ncbi:zf-C3HC4 domain-containing protein [Rhizoctonia solani AG-1 IA]|uniref:Zf-C3HC4 domain-containing protein n=1 Tax=Thanatephorus cucumeris (strain AG1-IA) TaxID=983506 RepID=L8WWQ4_THACA|nr:zf-C3HC4 domain-containing protein [Rhizoctonia solani AG-1 IA]
MDISILQNHHPGFVCLSLPNGTGSLCPNNDAIKELYTQPGPIALELESSNPLLFGTRPIRFIKLEAAQTSGSYTHICASMAQLMRAQSEGESSSNKYMHDEQHNRTISLWKYHKPPNGRYVTPQPPTSTAISAYPFLIDQVDGFWTSHLTLELNQFTEMFILQSCPVCFEEFDVEHKPHTIPCGHVFCLPCLDTVSRTAWDSARCPICRAQFDPVSARAVIGTDQPKQETELWQSLKSYTKANVSAQHLLTLPLEEELGRMGASENIHVAVSAMRMLFQAKNTSFELEVKCQALSTDRELLSTRVTDLEARLRQLQGALTIKEGYRSQDEVRNRFGPTSARSIRESAHTTTLNSGINSSHTSGLLSSPNCAQEKLALHRRVRGACPRQWYCAVTRPSVQTSYLSMSESASSFFLAQTFIRTMAGFGARN